jgi:hypothetical protein
VAIVGIGLERFRHEHEALAVEGGDAHLAAELVGRMFQKPRSRPAINYDEPT